MPIVVPSAISMGVPAYSIDQIIGVFSNTIHIAAPTAITGVTVATDTKTHGFGDSCYFQGIFTQDGGTTWNDFGAQTPNLSGGTPFFQSVDVEAYTDSNNVNLELDNYYDPVHSVGTAYDVTYKIYLIAKNTMALPLNPIKTNQKLIYNSANNYQKVYLSGTTSITVAAGATGSSPTITHNLNYIPKIRAFFISSNQVYGLNQWKFPVSTNTVPAIEAHITNTGLSFYSDQSSFLAPGVSGNIDYRIYLDS